MFARIGLGAFLSAADYIEAMRQRRELCASFAAAMAGVDAVVSANATGPAPAHRRGRRPSSTFERASYTAPYNLTGLPALSVPIGFESGLPLGLPDRRRPFDEAAVLRVGHAFEQSDRVSHAAPADRGAAAVAAVIARAALAGLALSLAGCTVLGGEPTLNDAQQVIADLKFVGSGNASDLDGFRRGRPSGRALQQRRHDRADGDREPSRRGRGAARACTAARRRSSSPASPTPAHRRQARSTPKPRPAKAGSSCSNSSPLRTDSAWLFTRKPEGAADYVDLGSTTRALATDIATTFRGAANGTVAVSHQAIRVGE